MVVLGEGTYGVVRPAKNGDGAVKELRKTKYRATLDESYIRSMSVCSLARPTEHHLVRCTPMTTVVLEGLIGPAGRYPRNQTLTIHMPRYRCDLRARIKADPSFYFTVDVQAILNDVATAVDYLHANWIVHRDIKLQNILLDEHDRAYLGDFDLSHRWNTRNMERGGYVMDTQCVYTVHYRPPETMLAAYEGKAQTIEQQMRGDVWSVGVVGLDLIDPAMRTLSMWHNAPKADNDAQMMLPQILGYFGLAADGWLMRHHRASLQRMGCRVGAPKYALNRRWPEGVDGRYKSALAGMLQTDPDRRFSAARVVLTLEGRPSARELAATADLEEVLAPPIQLDAKGMQPYASYYYSVYMRSPPPLRKKPSNRIVAVAAGALAHTYVFEVDYDLLDSLADAKCGNLVIRTIQLWIIALLNGNLALPDDLVHKITNAQ